MVSRSVAGRRNQENSLGKREGIKIVGKMREKEERRGETKEKRLEGK